MPHGLLPLGVVCTAAIVLLASTAVADVIPLSETFVVHGQATDTQRTPDVARAADHGFVVAWVGSIKRPPPSGARIYQRRFDENGTPFGHATALSGLVFPTSSDEEIHLTTLIGGGYAAVWENETGRDGDREGVFGALFDGDGRRLGEEFQVNQAFTTGDQSHPTVGDSDGYVLVVWDDLDLELGRQQVSAQRFTRLGERIGPELTLASTPDYDAELPRVAGLEGTAKQTFVVVWDAASATRPEFGYDVYGQIVAPAGQENVFIANEIRARDEGQPSVAATREGFIVSFTAFSFDSSDIYMRRFSSDGTPLSGDARVNSFDQGSQTASNVATSENGSFIVIWTSGDREIGSDGQDGDGLGLFGQAYKSDGSRLGSEFQVSTISNGDQGRTSDQPGIAFVNATDFVVTWQNKVGRNDPDVHARRFRLSEARRLCGDATGADLTIGVIDALTILRVSVELAQCDLCSCDVDASGSVAATDAQRVLRLAVGLQIATECPRC